MIIFSQGIFIRGDYPEEDASGLGASAEKGSHESGAYALPAIRLAHKPVTHLGGLPARLIMEKSAQVLSLAEHQNISFFGGGYDTSILQRHGLLIRYAGRDIDPNTIDWSRNDIRNFEVPIRAVHKAGGRIVLQLWHMGRLVHPDFLGGKPPVSASATTAPDHAHTPTGRKPFEPARAATARWPHSSSLLLPNGHRYA